ncbi:site-specific DNA-methyltransferase [Oceanispirochaeta crateris]|uniref:site-specific DNA-methyltransferase (adenine-specific) n=1 Tax=Oceanispirochaeta crateris TaxID=2518645 RepID=A0A5C1QKE9_9SPIO|nr:site-specific DNA-methyltransferase [Oceanispirochaeta crateris]QEN06612.1 site-specific DNA-methyltransferase [Oceanispirochaeta crateris]
MTSSSDFFSKTPLELKNLSENLGISPETLKSYFKDRKLPSDVHLQKLSEHFHYNKEQLKILWGVVDRETLEYLQKNLDVIPALKPGKRRIKKLNQTMNTDLGTLYRNDCLDVMAGMEDETVDLIFADPPFNLNKKYPSGMNDLLKEEEYILWMNRWVDELCRLLKPGGALFLWNLPRWNIEISKRLNKSLYFKNWIAVDLKYSLPIRGRLYPSHYSLLYFTKGKKANTFNPDRIPMQICPKCYGDLKDYGGYKSKMNKKGVNITDIWTDIPPVRHAKYKRRKNSNELSIKLLDRVIEMASKPGDLVFDPFGGSGSTYIVAELKDRRWIGTDIGPSDEIIARFKILDTERQILEDYRKDMNCLFTEQSLTQRKKRKLWTNESFEGS